MTDIDKSVLANAEKHLIPPLHTCFNTCRTPTNHVLPPTSLIIIMGKTLKKIQ